MKTRCVCVCVTVPVGYVFYSILLMYIYKNICVCVCGCLLVCHIRYVTFCFLISNVWYIKYYLQYCQSLWYMQCKIKYLLYLCTYAYIDICIFGFPPTGRQWHVKAYLFRRDPLVKMKASCERHHCCQSKVSHNNGQNAVQLAVLLLHNPWKKWVSYRHIQNQNLIFTPTNVKLLQVPLHTVHGQLHGMEKWRAWS